MTMQAEQLIGAQVTGGDGQVVGTVQQIFNDDKDGRPVWARIRSGKQDRFVPLGGSRVTKEGLSVPFDAKIIMSSPDVGAERHISAAETAQLNRHFGLTVPAQAGSPDAGTKAGQDAGTTAGQDAGTRAGQDAGTRAGQDAGTRAGQDAGTRAGQDAGTRTGEEWLTRTEERADVGTELRESGRVRLHRYVDVEPVEQAVRVFHEEYEVERVAITPEEQVRGMIAEGEQEVILHEERPVLRKEAVPVERVRLVVKRVEEDRILRDEVRRERVEIETDDGRRAPAPAEPGAQNRRRG